MNAHLSRALAASALLTMLATGCGGDAVTEASSDGEEGFQSPLADYMGFDVDFGFDGDREAELQEQIVTCMAKEGFEYTPEVTDVSAFEEAETADGVREGSKEYAEKYGFGITTTALPQSAVGPNLVGHNSDDFFDVTGPDSNPNYDYLQSLSPAEQQAYHTALDGDMSGPEIDESMTDEEIEEAEEAFQADYEPTGCFNEAYNIGANGAMDFYTEFEDRLEAVFDGALEDHPRIVAFEQKLSGCVADKGQTYLSQSELYDSFYEKLSPIEEGYWEQIGLAMADVEFDDNGMPPAGFQQPEPELNDADKAALGELQAEEVALAVAYYDCGGSEQETSRIFNEVRIELEEQFIEDNRAVLDAFKAGNA